MNRVRLGLPAFIAAAAVILTASPTSAQGCILLRQTCPAFGTTGSSDLQPGTWNVTFTGRNSTADKHYNGTERQIQREREQTYVVNRQNSLTATLSYQFSPRISLNASVPWVEASWGIPSPRAGGPRARANENARGLGDITTLARVSIFNPLTTHRTWNLQVGGGVKLPTGNNEATDVFPDGSGNNNVERYVDLSVHPGDGGWGAIFDLQGYKMMGRVTAFGSGTWLANPRNTGTASRGNLVMNANPSNVNTVSDQFVFRAGTAVSIFQRATDTGVRQISATIAWRMEGVPRYDLFGRSDGFRRPGVEMYWEPGITVTLGRHAMSFNLPIGYYFNRFRNPYTGNRGDSTFPEYVAIATYAVRLHRTPKHHIMTDDGAVGGKAEDAPAPKQAAEKQTQK
jgi:hypothetical protein